jgi:hypothetical protein
LIVGAKDKSLIQQLVMECIVAIEEYREQATEEVSCEREWNDQFSDIWDELHVK